MSDERGGGSAYVGLGISFGVALGVILGAITGQWWWLGICTAIGVIVGAALSQANKGNQE